MEYDLIRKAHVSSTNTSLAALKNEGLLRGDTVLVSDYQEDGRGQGAHGWDSREGENILMSWLIQPELLSASEQFLISKVVSLSICDHFNDFVGTTYIKWPNDILIGNRKIAGILIEHGIMQDRIAHSIIGIGLNVNQKDFDTYPLLPTSLYLETGSKHDIEKQLRKLLKALYKRYDQLRDGDFEGLNSAYLERLYRYRQQSIFEAEGKKFEGVIMGVNEYGQLLVKVREETVRFNFQEIRILLH